MDLVSTSKFRNENMEISRVLAKLHISSNLIHLQEQNLKIRIIKRLFSRKVQTFDQKLSHCGRGLSEWLCWHKNLIDVTLSPSLPIKRDITHGRLQISLEMASCAWTDASVFSFLNILYRLYWRMDGRIFARNSINSPVEFTSYLHI